MIIKDEHFSFANETYKTELYIYLIRYFGVKYRYMFLRVVLYLDKPVGRVKIIQRVKLYILLDVLLCGIAEYFYELRRSSNYKQRAKILSDTTQQNV